MNRYEERRTTPIGELVSFFLVLVVMTVSAFIGGILVTEKRTADDTEAAIVILADMKARLDALEPWCLAGEVVHTYTGEDGTKTATIVFPGSVELPN